MGSESSSLYRRLARGTRFQTQNLEGRSDMGASLGLAAPFRNGKFQSNQGSSRLLKNSARFRKRRLMSISTMRRRPAKTLAKRGSLSISRPPLSASAAAPDCRRRQRSKSPSDAITATEPGLLLPGDRLDPAESLLDALADALADGIAAVP